MEKLSKIIVIICISCFCRYEHTYSQIVYSWQDFVENYLSEEADALPDEGVMETLYDIHCHPFDINTVTKEQLEELPFLTDRLIEEILSYQYRYGPLKSLDELQLVYTMDFETFQYLTLFLTVTDIRPDNRFPSWQNYLKYGKRTILLQTDLPLYWKEGFKRHSPESLEKNPNKQYAGKPFTVSIRFDWTYKDKLSTGFTADHDAGEPFFTFRDKNRGFDFYSWYLLLKDFNKWLKTLALGQYRLGFGQGLIMNTNFSMGKQSLFTAVTRNVSPVRKHSSRSEYNYFRGLAGTVQIGKNLQATLFYSYVDKDANIDKNGLITSWKNDGYHRTPLEISKKHNTVNQTIGGNINYNNPYFHIGLTGVHNYFNRLFKTYPEGYRKYYPEASRQWNVSTDYGLYYKRHSLQGETALSNDKAIATINTLRLNMADAWQLLLLHRFYSYKFNSMYGKSYSEGSLVKNESGLSGGIKYSSYRFNLTTFADFFYFPWETYKASAGSRGYELSIQGYYAFSDAASVNFRYRFKSKQQDHTGAEAYPPGLRFYSRHSPRLQSEITWKDMTFKTSLNYTSVHFAGKRSQGMLVSQSVRLPQLFKILDLQLNGHYFHTDNYETRLSAYESGLLYQFGFSSFYGHGCRFSLLARCSPVKSLSLLAKFGHTRYFDRTRIGSGLEMSEGNHRENISLQMRYKF